MDNATHYIHIGGGLYRPEYDVKPPVDELQVMHAKALEMAKRANIGRVHSLTQRQQWLDTATELRDGDGVVLATVYVAWEGLVARVGIQQLAEPSFMKL